MRKLRNRGVKGLAWVYTATWRSQAHGSHVCIPSAPCPQGQLCRPERPCTAQSPWALQGGFQMPQGGFTELPWQPPETRAPHWTPALRRPLARSHAASRTEPGSSRTPLCGQLRP